MLYGTDEMGQVEGHRTPLREVLSLYAPATAPQIWALNLIIHRLNEDMINGVRGGQVSWQVIHWQVLTG